MNQTSITVPPRTKSFEGAARRVGLEVEFAAISARDAATHVRDLFGGTINEIDPHAFEITGTTLGEFRTELDLQYVHSTPPDEDAARTGSQFRRAVQEMLGEVSGVVVPCEVICPPVALDDLPRLEKLLVSLRQAGARDTRSGLFYAFGAQLNPEIADQSAGYITSVLKAYLMLSDWLRAEIELDLTRRLLSFVDPFPNAYAAVVTAPDYWPDIDHLMDDYLAYNPTRNRELDMLPLFAYLDAERVTSAVEDELIKPRPTFHYRLPDCRIADETWSVVGEWNRWLAVESLAGRPESLAELAAAWLVETPPSAYDRVVGWLDRVLGSE